MSTGACRSVRAAVSPPNPPPIITTCGREELGAMSTALEEDGVRATQSESIRPGI
jgi:hypothetical protein